MMRPHTSICSPFVSLTPFCLLGEVDMPCCGHFATYWSRCKQWKQKSLPSLSSGPSDTTLVYTVYSEPLPPRKMPSKATSKVRAVMVDESDMYSALDGIFGRGTYEVALDRDVYRIAGPRKLTTVSALGTKVRPLLTWLPERKTGILEMSPGRKRWEDGGVIGGRSHWWRVDEWIKEGTCLAVASGILGACRRHAHTPWLRGPITAGSGT